MAKAIGERGSWFAKVDGRRLPCIHAKRLSGMTYTDPFDREEVAHKVDEFIAALKSEKRAILTDGTPIKNPAGKIVGWERSSYVAVFRIDDIRYDKIGGLQMELVERVSNLD